MFSDLKKKSKYGFLFHKDEKDRMMRFWLSSRESISIPKKKKENYCMNYTSCDLYEVRLRHIEVEIPINDKIRFDSQTKIPVCCSKAAIGNISE